MNTHYRTMTSGDSSPLERLRTACLGQGFSGYRGIGRLFNQLDDDGNHNVSLDEFVRGLRTQKIDIGNQDLAAVFSQFDKDQNAELSVQEFLKAISPPMSVYRRGVIQECFNSIDVTGDGKINLDDMRGEIVI